MNRLPLSAVAVLLSAAAANAGNLPIYGGPTYDAATGTGYQSYTLDYFESSGATAGDGSGLTTMARFAGGTVASNVPVAWTPGGFSTFAVPAIAGTGRPIAIVDSRNFAGVAVGSQFRNSSDGNHNSQAIRWDTPSQPVVLGNGLSGASVGSYAGDVNAAGIVVGASSLYQADSNGFYTNTLNRPVRWAAGTTTATPLDVAGASGKTATFNSGGTAGIGTDGTTYGTVYSYEVLSPTFSGNFNLTAVRWNAGGTALTELAHAAAPAGAYLEDFVTKVRPNGWLAGATETSVNGVGTRRAPTRWAPDGSVTVLDLPAGSVDAGSFNQAIALNDAGTVVGRVATQAGSSDGFRPVRWNSNTSAATMLGLLGTPTTTTSAWALDVNNAGVAVGVQRLHGRDVDGLAVLWGVDGVAVDLNTLIDSASGWRLIEADSISDSGWIAGVGFYDPDGTGPVAAYTRSFLIQVPEPTTCGFIALIALPLLRRRRS